MHRVTPWALERESAFHEPQNADPARGRGGGKTAAAAAGVRARTGGQGSTYAQPQALVRRALRGGQQDALRLDGVRLCRAADAAGQNTHRSRHHLDDGAAVPPSRRRAPC